MELSSQTSSSNRRPSRSDREECFARRQSSLTVRREGEMCGRVPRLRLTLRTARIVGEAIAVVITVVAGLIGVVLPDCACGRAVWPGSGQRGVDGTLAAADRTAHRAPVRKRSPRKQLRPVCRFVHRIGDDRRGDGKLAYPGTHVPPGRVSGDRHMEGLRLHIVGYSGIHPRHGGASLPVGQSCTACDDGSVTTVRYHWDGTRVVMLDPPPPS